MALRKDEKVELENVDLGRRPFAWEHAERLLNAKYNKGLWALPANSKYKLENGKLHRNAIQRANQSPKK
jgi:hypothetical protein